MKYKCFIIAEGYIFEPENNNTRYTLNIPDINLSFIPNVGQQINFIIAQDSYYEAYKKDPSLPDKPDFLNEYWDEYNGVHDIRSVELDVINVSYYPINDIFVIRCKGNEWGDGDMRYIRENFHRTGMKYTFEVW